MAKLDESIRERRRRAIAAGKDPVPSSHQGVTKERIRQTLQSLRAESSDTVDAVFALLDPGGSWFRSLGGTSYRFGDGATTAHIACHVGILQRGGTKLDREGRDYWVKPLRELGIIEPVYLDPKSKQFVAGHPVAKSPNSAYSLNPEFVEVLAAKPAEFGGTLERWNSEDARRRRARLGRAAAKAAEKRVDTKHADLIRASIDFYAPHFLPGYEVLYTDATDGDRVTPEEQEKLAAVGLSLGIADAWPDVLLWNEELRSLWVIEAVTSDGEVDQTKVDSVLLLAERAGIEDVGFTTTYPTWKVAAARQGRVKNLAAGTHVWIQDDAARQLLVCDPEELE